jgi:flavin-dependent dehydrogenase
MERAGSSTHPFDLAILGGGPAGTAAALEARRRGLQVAIWEGDRFPRHKVCGEFVSAESLPLLQQEIPSALARSAVIRRADFVAQGGRRYSFMLPGVARGLSRFVLDEALWQATIRSGAQTCEGTAIRCIGTWSAGPGLDAPLPSRPLWEVHPAKGDSRSARAVLIACGRWWSLGGLPSPCQDERAAGPWLGAKAHFAGVPPRDAIEMYFFPGGYCGLAPIEDGLVNACCLVHRSLTRSAGAGKLLDFASWLKKVARHPALDARLRDATQVFRTIATAPIHPMWTRSRGNHSGALLAGDAAGFLDPFTGDGISQALYAGRLAAETVAQACAGDRASLLLAADAYRRRLRQAVGSSYRVAALLRLLVRAPAGLQEFAATLLSGFAAGLVGRTRWRGNTAVEPGAME